MDLCGKRLLTRKDAVGVPEAIVEGDPITFNTANGPYKAKKQVLIDVSTPVSYTHLTLPTIYSV